MFNHGGSGETNVVHASDALACRSYTTQIIDVSSATPLSNFILVPADPDHALGVYSVTINYLANGAGSAGTVNIGTRDDTDSIVDAFSTATTASGLQDTSANVTLASTLRGSSHLSGGRPVIPKNKPVYCSVSQGASNTADFTLTIKVFPIEPGQ